MTVFSFAWTTPLNKETGEKIIYLYERVLIVDIDSWSLHRYIMHEHWVTVTDYTSHLQAELL